MVCVGRSERPSTYNGLSEIKLPMEKSKTRDGRAQNRNLKEFFKIFEYKLIKIHSHLALRPRFVPRNLAA